jgi:hypothetical protein
MISFAKPCPAPRSHEQFLEMLPAIHEQSLDLIGIIRERYLTNRAADLSITEASALIDELKAATNGTWANR